MDTYGYYSLPSAILNNALSSLKLAISYLPGCNIIRILITLLALFITAYRLNPDCIPQITIHIHE